jgi:hypothetical protein
MAERTCDSAVDVVSASCRNRESRLRRVDIRRQFAAKAPLPQAEQIVGEVEIIQDSRIDWKVPMRPAARCLGDA